MSRVDHHLQHSIMGRLGSFWSRAVSSATQDQARTIATLAANAPDLIRLGVPVSKLATERRAMVHRVRVPFLDGDFVFVGPDLTDVWRSTLGLQDGTYLKVIRRHLSDQVPTSQLLVGSNGRPLGADLGHLLSVAQASEGDARIDSLYVLPIPSGVTPVVIATRHVDRVLVQGIDFEAGAGYITMRESPGSVFFAGGFTILTAIVDVRMPYDFTTQVNGPSFGSKFVAAYYKGALSRSSFERAAAQAAGLLVLEQDDTVVKVHRQSPDLVRYVFLKAGPVDVGYPHVELEAGVDYQKGHIVSNGFRIVSGGAPGWLRRAADGRTLLVEGAVSVPDLYLPSGMTMAYFVETGEGGKPHTRIHLQGEDFKLDALWSLQRNHERRTGLYLSDVVGLSPARPRVAFDMHAILETFYGPRLLLVIPDLDGAHPSYRQRLREFVLREKPVGSAVLFVEEPTGLPPAGSYEPLAPSEEFYFYGSPPGFTSGALVHGDLMLGYGAEVLVYQAASQGYPSGALLFDDSMLGYGAEVLTHQAT
jgi:hypothetical protein